MGLRLMITSCFSLKHMEQNLITALPWIWVLIIYQTKDTFQEFKTKEWDVYWTQDWGLRVLYWLPSNFYLTFAFNLSQHQGLFQWVGSLHQVIKVLELQLQHQSFQWVFRVDFLFDWLIWSYCPRDSGEPSPALQFESVNSLVLSLLHGPTLTSIHDYWENHSFDCMDLCWQSDVSVFLIHCLGLP